MRRYETIVIMDADLTETDRAAILERLDSMIQQQKGLLVAFDEWGSRKLAYEIKKKNRGYYLRIDFCGEGALVNEIERSFRIDDRILKYMTVLLDEAVDVAALRAELAEKEAREAEEAEPAEAAVDETAAGADVAAAGADVAAAGADVAAAGDDAVKTPAEAAAAPAADTVEAAAASTDDTQQKE